MTDADPNTAATGAPAAPADPNPGTAGSASTQTAQPASPPQGLGSLLPTMGRIVIVREPGRADAPGIVVAVHNPTIDAQVFRGDHMPHSSHRLEQLTNLTDEKARGWFWPQRV